MMNGFLVDVRVTTEANLEVEVDASDLSWDEYRSLVTSLEDCLSQIDKTYSIRSELSRGRSLRARYRRVSSEDRRRKLRFSPFPSNFSNKLRNARGFIYKLVDECCVRVEEVGRRIVYMLPKHLAPEFMETVLNMNTMVIEPLEKKIEEFKASQDFLKVKQILHAHKIPPTVIDKSFSLGRFTADLIPVDFDYSVDKDEVYSKLQASKGLEEMKRQLERKYQEYVAAATADVIQKITELASLTKFGKATKRRLKRVAEMCKSLGLTQMLEVCEKLIKVATSKPSKRQQTIIQEFGEQNLVEAVKRLILGGYARDLSV